MAGNVVNIAERREAQTRRLLEHGHAVSNDGRDYGHELCARCLGHFASTDTCRICGTPPCSCHLPSVCGDPGHACSECVDHYGIAHGEPGHVSKSCKVCRDADQPPGAA